MRVGKLLFKIRSIYHEVTFGAAGSFKFYKMKRA